jgi:perosamine synthetase
LDHHVAASRLRRAAALATRAVEGARDALRGKRRYCLYYSTITATDAILALSYALAALLRVPVARARRAELAGAVRSRYGGEAFFYGSARSALYDHLCALDLPAGSEVVVTGFTCEVVANAVIQAGLRPVYADIDPDTYCMTAETLRNVMSERTSAVIVQHTFGIPAPLDELIPVARSHNAFVIEDCAVALGTSHAGKPVGVFGDAAIFSFELSKVITSGRGGLLLLNNRALSSRQRARYSEVPEPSATRAAQVLAQLGLSGFLYRPRVHPVGELVALILFKLGIFQASTSQTEREGGRPQGYLVRLAPGQAAILLRQWRRLPAIFSQARSLTAKYDAAFAGAAARTGAPDSQACLVRYPIHVRDRESLSAALDAEGIEMGSWFSAPLSSAAIEHERFGYQYGMCPVAETTARTVCNLPTHPRMTGELTGRVIATTQAVFARQAQEDEGVFE